LASKYHPDLASNTKSSELGTGRKGGVPEAATCPIPGPEEGPKEEEDEGGGREEEEEEEGTFVGCHLA